MATIGATLVIGPADHGRALSLDEFLEAEVEEGYRYELGRGILEVTQVPGDPNRQVVTNLYDAIAQYRRMNPGVVLSYGGSSEFQLGLPGFMSGRNPDLGVVLRGTPRDCRGRTGPSLAAEVVSSGSVKRDYETKRDEYLAYGLLEYWIVDPIVRQVTVLTRRGDIWAEAVFRDHQVIQSMVLPGLSVAVAELWLDVDGDDSEPSAP